MDRLLNAFESVWIWDSEFVPNPGWRVKPVCMSAVEMRTGRTVSARWDTEDERHDNPLDFGPHAVHVMFMSCADLGFALAAGWGLPVNVIDPWVEYRNLTNGHVDNTGEKLEHGLIAACRAYGIHDTTPQDQKEAYRDRIMHGFPFDNLCGTGRTHMDNIVLYCREDVEMLRKLCERLIPDVENLDQALHRGRYMKAAVCLEWNGVPVDVDTLRRLQAGTKSLRKSVARRFEDDLHLGVYIFDKNGDPHFNKAGFTRWVRRMGFDEKTWPFNDEFASADDQEVLEQKAQMYADTHPEIETFRQLRKFLTIAKSQFKFPVGPDGRNRSQVMPFMASSGRSQPPTSENIPNTTKALRSLLAPHDGQVLMQRDWSNAEYGIAAALSKDKKRWDHYIHRDAYLVKAADFGFCDYTATKETHYELRKKFKPVVLAGQYGQTAAGLAGVLDITVNEAAMYMKREKKLYPVYQAWLDANAEDREFDGYVETEFGWRVWLPLDNTKSQMASHNAHLVRKALNHPMQGNCAEIMRMATCLATERGIDVGASVHDAFFYTAPADCWQDVDEAMLGCMAEACEFVLGDGYVLKSARDVVHYPDHYQHEDGIAMWTRIQQALEAV